MADAIVRNESPGTEDSAVSAVSWAAIIAGGLSSAAVTLVLLAFGAGLGFSSVSPWQNWLVGLIGIEPVTHQLESRGRTKKLGWSESNWTPIKQRCC